ncbi:MAG TPA: L-ribulose-5-phosphate 4-epimerase AraD [Clostridiaceae bacterium]|nr:L-ribulose-5-phosphate 4-epimerase AraD [Clostridiaceae bacterium]
MKHKELRQKVCETNRLLPKLDLAIFTWGNVSEADREAGVFAIKPSGVAYDKLEPNDIVVVSLETGETVAGKLKPSRDTATHLVLYQKFANIGGIVHTHSPWAVSWAQAERALPAYSTSHADYFYGNVPCTRKLTDQELKEAYEKNTGLVIVETFEKNQIDPDAVPAVLVAGHGPFIWGPDSMKAVENARVLEECCKMAYRAEVINPEISGIEQSLLDEHYFHKHGKYAGYGQ